MSNLFGFSFDDDKKKGSGKNIVSPIPPSNADESDFFVSSGFNSQYIDTEGVYKNEHDLIKRYREMSLYPECDSAIEDIVNEAIVSDIDDSPVEIELSNLNASDKLKKIIYKEFKKIKELLQFDRSSHEIFRNWYIDGRLYYHKVIDLKKPEEGIQELRYIDPLDIKFVKKKKEINDKTKVINNTLTTLDLNTEIEEYYEYVVERAKYGSGSKSIKIAKEAIVYCTSGLIDRNKKSTLSYLQKAIKAFNQLYMIEDSLVIYRLSRAPERRIFYIDVGNLPKVKAEQYLRDVMSRYRNKLVYNANTGEIRDDKKFMSMLEDFWLPRREGGRGTEISTLPGGQNLGEITDIEYFQKKLYRALSVPESRLANSEGFNLGRSSEILRDELKFSKFVSRLRKRFSRLFNDLLKTQLILKNIVTPEDWNEMVEHIQYDYIYDNHFAELKNSELMNERLGLLSTIEPYIGKYYSNDYIKRKVLRQTEEEILEMKQQIEKEIKSGELPDPNALEVDVEGENTGVLGKVPLEPEVDGSSTEVPEDR